MTMGEYIKKLRKEHDLTQDELGQKLNPPVNRAAINKWETGQVENIKRTHIEQMSKIFGVKPSELMCFNTEWDLIYNPEGKLSDEAMVFEVVKNKLGTDYSRLLTYFQMLNDLGKKKAMDDCEDLTNLPKYTDGSSEVQD
jgi:repressor LexA